MCETSSNTTRLCLVSAFGTEKVYKTPDVGIHPMWNIRDVYKAKLNQERILLQRSENPTLILRPTVLSDASVPVNPIMTRRRDLAKQILEWVDYTQV